MSSEFRMHYAGKRLSLRVRNVPLNTVLEGISERTGIPIHYDGPDGPSTTIAFDALPVDAAIGRLVPNAGMVYVKGTRPDEFLLTAAAWPSHTS